MYLREQMKVRASDFLFYLPGRALDNVQLQTMPLMHQKAFKSMDDQCLKFINKYFRYEIV